MDPDRLVALLPDLLERGWGVTPTALGPLPAGMNSVVARVDLPDGVWVAKWVPAAAAGVLDHGSAIAARLAGYGLATGPARPTRAGALSLRTGEGAIALLEHLDGTPLTAADPDQRAMAEVLARVHASEYTVRKAPFLHDWWAEPAAEPAWLAPVLARILQRYDALPPLSWGIVHADPNPDAFLRLACGDVGLIDWTGAEVAPVLYDLASALMYLGGRDHGSAFLRRYREVGPVPADELDAHRELFGSVRAGVQAAYFANRLATDDLTGITDRAENHKGLTDARTMLAAHGIETPDCEASR